MITFLSIVLAVLIAANVWLMFYTAKSERQRRRLLQERMDECDERIGEAITEMGKAKARLREMQSANAALKKSFEETVQEYEKTLALNKRLLKQNKELSERGVLLLPKDCVPKDVTMEEFSKWWKDEGYKMVKSNLVDAGQPTHHTQPGEPADKPVKQRRGRKPKK